MTGYEHPPMRLINPTGRRTQAHAVMIGGVRLCFSYKTLVGVMSRGHVAKRGNIWGPTTGRHMREFGLGDHAVTLEPDELERYARQEIHRATMEAQNI